jgi:hypothetical protein
VPRILESGLFSLGAGFSNTTNYEMEYMVSFCTVTQDTQVMSGERAATATQTLPQHDFYFMTRLTAAAILSLR